MIRSIMQGLSLGLVPLALGLLLDLVSLRCRIYTWRTGKHSSGFPFVGLAGYVLAVLLMPTSLIGWGQPFGWRLIGFKALDLTALTLFHALCQWPVTLKLLKARK